MFGCVLAKNKKDCACTYYVMTLLRMWRGEKIRVARINSLRGNPPLGQGSTALYIYTRYIYSYDLFSPLKTRKNFLAKNKKNKLSKMRKIIS